MNKRIVKLFLSISFFVLLFPVFSGGVRADNNNNNLGVCNITIGGTSVSPGSTVDVYPQMKANNNFSGDVYTYDIQVCGDPLVTKYAQEQNAAPSICLEGTNRKIIAATSKTIYGVFTNWDNFALSKTSSGCYSGSIRTNRPLDGSIVDIELDGESAQKCDSNMPVCRRVNVNFKTDVLEPAKEECDDLKNSVKSCDFLQIPSLGDGNLIVNEPVSITGTVDKLIGKADCGFSNVAEISVTVKDYAGDYETKEYYSVGDSINISYTPKKIGSHVVEYISRVRPDADGSALVSRVAAKCELGFTICAEDDETCDSEEEPIRLDGQEGENADPYAICDSNLVIGSQAHGNCTECYGNQGIWTAVGCIDQKPENMVKKVINIGVGILGGIFLLRVLAASFMLTTSQGDVKKTSEAKQMITEAVIGIVFVLFSVTILQFIGVDVMRLPGFGG